MNRNNTVAAVLMFCQILQGNCTRDFLYLHNHGNHVVDMLIQFRQNNTSSSFKM